MRQLVFPGDLRGLARTELDSSRSRYLLRVLRRGKGDRFEAVDEAGNRFECVLENEDPRRAIVGLRALGANDDSRGRIALVQGLPKGPKLDGIIRQATEVGAADILPLLSRHCVAREEDASDREEKLARRRRIVTEARQQSGSPVATVVHRTVDLSSLDAELENRGYEKGKSIRILCHETVMGSDSLHGLCADSDADIVVAVGPEGGFAPDEVEIFTSMGFVPVHFGVPILRTETAAIFALSALAIIRSERDSWTRS